MGPRQHPGPNVHSNEPNIQRLDVSNPKARPVAQGGIACARSHDRLLQQTKERAVFQELRVEVQQVPIKQTQQIKPARKAIANPPPIEAAAAAEFRESDRRRQQHNDAPVATAITRRRVKSFIAEQEDIAMSQSQIKLRVQEKDRKSGQQPIPQSIHAVHRNPRNRPQYEKS